MEKKIEQSSFETQEDIKEDIMANEQPSINLKAEKKEAPIAERVNVATDNQDKDLKAQESQYDRKTLSGFKKWVATTMIMGSSLLAVGCNTEKAPIKNPQPQKTESTQDGFTDSAHDNVQQRLKIKRAEVKRMHENSRIGK